MNLTYFHTQKRENVEDINNSPVNIRSDVKTSEVATLVDSNEISPAQFYIWQKTGCGIRNFLSFETENWICWLLRHYLNC